MSTQPNYDLSAWSDSFDGVLQKLAVDPTYGIEEHEALRRRKTIGPNQLQAAKRRHQNSSPRPSAETTPKTGRSVKRRPPGDEQ